MTIQYTAADLLMKIKGNDNSYASTYKKKALEADTDVQTLQDGLAGLRKQVKGLAKYSSDTTTKPKLERQLKEIVKSYNAIKKNAGGIKDEELNKQLSKLDGLFAENEKALKKIGIKKSKAKYELDSDIFEKAEDKDIDKLFLGKGCFIRQADKILRGVEERAGNAEYSIAERRVSKTVRYSKDEMLLAFSYTLGKETAEALKGCGQLLDIAPDEAENKELVRACLNDFMLAYNQINQTKEDGVLKQLCADKSDKFDALGIQFGTDGNMEYKSGVDEDAVLGTEDFKNALKDLFGENAEFRKAIASHSQKVFNDIIAPEKIGVSIIDAYA